MNSPTNKLAVSAITALLLSAFGTMPSYAATIPGAERGTALVQLKDTANLEVFHEFNLLSVEPVGENSPGLYQVELDPFSSYESQIASLASSDAVSFAEPNYLIQVRDTSNDPQVITEETWGLYASSSTSAFGSNAVGAWASGYTGSKAVYVAVIDSGIDVAHPDLAANMWVNSGEIAGNGLDDDANGFVDDINGYDFLNGDGSVFDANEHPHGTHVAGTIGAVGGNGVGVAGVAWNLNLISAKIANGQGASTTVDAIRAIDYVTMLRTKKGLDIIATNNSWGGTGYSKALEDAIKRGGDVGIIFVAAAGNDGQNLDAANQYPAEYDCTTPHRPFDCVVSVAAIGQNGDLAGYSNYSGIAVDIAAPGTNVLSTVPGGYDMLSGTSMAAPHVTGAIALCLASYRGITAKQAIEKLKATAVSNPSLSGKVVTGGHLNVSAMVSSCAQESTAMSGALTNHVGSALYTDRARLDWDDTATGDYEQEIQIAVGPDGCRGTFSHHAFIGPGLTALPVFNLEEAQFYCFRVRAIRDGQTTTWATSPVFITWTSNLPFLTGKVFMSDGVTPVAGVPVRWLAEGAVPGLDDSNALITYTNLSGEYVLQVSNGTPGELFIGMTRDAARGRMTTPMIPWGLRASGKLTINQDAVVNLVLPEQRVVNFTLTDEDTGLPIAGANLLYEDLADNCIAGTFTLFPGASESRCQFWPTGYSGRAAKTDANGKVSIAVLDGKYTQNKIQTISFIHPTSAGRIANFAITPSTSGNVSVVMRGSVNITGQVFLDDGVTPVANATVKWLPDGTPRAGENTNALSTTTNAQGEYTLRVSLGNAGQISLHTPRDARSGARSNPLLPWGIWAWTTVAAVTESKVINLKAPKYKNVTVKVVNGSGAPIANAVVQSADLSVGCRPGVYTVFAGGTSPGCTSLPTGYSFAAPRTNLNGELVLPLMELAQTFTTQYRLSVAHPTIGALVGTFTTSPTADFTQVITLSELVTVSGRVLMADGVTVVKNAPVKWLPVGLNGGPGFDDVPAVKTDSEGRYSLQVSPGTQGELFVNTNRRVSTTDLADPQLPWGLYAGGTVTITASRTIDITLPRIEYLDYTVVEFASEEPVAGAKFVYGGLGETCTRNVYTPFPGATNPGCSFWPSGYSNTPVISNSQGKAKIPVLAASQLAYFDRFTFAVTHPIDNARVLTANATGSTTSKLIMPGTPSKPEQPNATPLTNEVRLTWTEPWNGGAFIDYYKIWISPNADGPFTLVTSGSCAGLVAPDQRTCVVTGLTPGVTYYFAIIAHNVVGYSQLSSATSATPLAAIGSFQQSSSPTITGSAVVGQFLVATPGTWDSGTSFDYQWLLDGSAISGAIGSSYLVKAQDASKVISVRVTARKTGIESVTRTSVTMTPTWPTNGKLVDVSGTPAVGGMLTARASSLLGSAPVSYQWLRAGQPISGATLSYYEPTAADAGEAITVMLTSSVLSAVPEEIIKSEQVVITSITEAVAITRSGLIEAVTSNTTTTASPVVTESPTASPIATQSPAVAEAASTSKPVAPVVQRTLAPFKPGAKALTQAQRKAIIDLLKANPTATKLTCTAVRTANTSKAKSLLLRKQAQQVCSYAVTQRKGLKVWVHSRVSENKRAEGLLVVGTANPDAETNR
ncbi:S8 family serine peptidase [Aquiluna sp. KACHI24]|uniref:S8 family serine peptidase n=1 Tax=Aquiluna sp. KACHI24 TaxID=2968831 RepID=UPI0022307E3A|nr:S8 family serine peptidase [Aquiluna sp. KACHI24]